MSASARYPNLEKLSANNEARGVILDFLDWLKEQGYILSQWGDLELHIARESHDNLVFRYLEIDQAELEKERLAVLEMVK